MRLIFLSLFCFLFIQTSHAQQDCSSAEPICSNIVQGLNPTGVGSQQDLTAANWACIGGPESNSHFFIFSVVQSGTLVFTIRPDRIIPATSRLDSIADFDFAIWEVTPNASSKGCEACDIVHTTAPMRCNWAGLVPFTTTYAQTLTGLSTTATTPSSGIGGPQFNTAINATAGETYILFIDQFDPAYTLDYKIDFTASTAVISGTTPPAFASASTPCGYAGDNLVVNMLQMVRTNSVASNGSDFYVTDAAGTRFDPISARPFYAATDKMQKILLQFSSVLPSGNYTIHAKTGTDGNTLFDLCGNQQLTTDTKAFTLGIAPNAPSIKVLDTPACAKARLVLSRPVLCNTIAANGSDFRIVGPGNVSVTVAVPRTCGVVSRNCTGNITMADTIDIIFNKPIEVPGIYTINFGEGTDGNSITDSCQVSIANGFQFVVSDKGYIGTSVSSFVICKPDYVSLSGALTVPPAAVLPGFNWSPGTYLSDSTTATTVAYVPATTTYTVRITDTSRCYRRAQTQIIVPVRDSRIAGKDTSICVGESYRMVASGGSTYFWYPATGLSCTNCADPIVNPATTTTYHAVITDANGCSDTVSRTIKVNPLPFISAGKDTTMVYGASLQLYAFSPAGKYYYWEPISGMNNANIPNPIITPKVTTRYVVFVVDTNYCKNTDTINVNVRTDIRVTVPSGFTPNNDGLNDRFRVGNLSFQKVVEFRVFNRWGQEVFTANDNKGWDGVVNGALADAGNYQYLIRVAYPDSRTEQFKGDVTLIR